MATGWRVLLAVLGAVLVAVVIAIDPLLLLGFSGWVLREAIPWL